MDVDTQINQRDRPLTSADVVRLLHKVGNSHKLDLQGQNLQGIDLASFKLAGATLSGANLVNSHLFEIDLQGANLSGADLSGADLIGAHLQEVNLSGTNLSGTNLSQANLSQANLSQANLRDANLSRCDLSQVNLSNAVMGQTILVNVDLRTAKGLETVQHQTLSGIDTATIYQSVGNIPETFLRGTGIPDSFITYISSLVSKPIEYYSCFISYSSKDQEFAERLYADLQSHNIRCWYAPEDLRLGDLIRPRIEESIRIYDKLLLILSKYSMQSGWVEEEVETALAKEHKEKRDVLFPIRLDDEVMRAKESWPALIRNTRHLGDFSNWKDHDSYQQAFNRLLRDLKAETHAPILKEGQPLATKDVAHEGTSTLHLRIIEDPLTVHNLSTVFSAFTELSTKCWLISKSRFADLTEYTQTHNRQFNEESGLIISSITYNSPFNVKLKFSMEDVAKAVKIIIDAVIGANGRKKELELKNKDLETEIDKKKQKLLADDDSHRIENQKALIELYDRQLDLKRKQIDLLDYASEKVPKIVEMLNPNAGIEDKKIALNSLVKSILGLEEANGLELVSLSQESSEQIDAVDNE